MRSDAGVPELAFHLVEPHGEVIEPHTCQNELADRRWESREKGVERLWKAPHRPLATQPHDVVW